MDYLLVRIDLGSIGQPSKQTNSSDPNTRDKMPRARELASTVVVVYLSRTSGILQAAMVLRERDCSLPILAVLSCCLKPASISFGNVCPRSQISTSLRIFGFWSSGAAWNRSLIRKGRTSVIFCTPEANVPGAALRETACPAFLARSSH